MNKIFRVKFDAVKNISTVMSELAIGAALCGAVIAAPSAMASIVSADIPYQTYRDFAENRGEFTPGSLSIPVYDKAGKVRGYLDKAPMPDFSGVYSRSVGVATLISPQYVTSVKHNGGYQNVIFADGQASYQLVDRNEQPSRDFHVPRLSKLVTEVAPELVTDAGMGARVYMDSRRFPVFYRMGSGDQYVMNSPGKINDRGQMTHIDSAYDILTGGVVSTPERSDSQIVASGDGLMLPTLSRGGDSGSPLFAFDAQRQRWVLVGVLLGGWEGAGINNMIWTTVDAGFIQKVRDEDTDPAITADSKKGPLTWKFNDGDGTGSLTQQGTSWAMHGQKGSDQNAGHNLTFLGKDGHVILENSVNQGAGALTFNDDYTVSAVSGQTWKGGGLNILPGASVTWQVNGVKGDELHKIGPGTLRINASGVNEGKLSVGDGTVILDQRPDSAGHIQAFSVVSIVSGRPTLVLGDGRQLDPDNIIWGYRGGRLDINGNNTTFHHLLAADNGAVITNENKTPATVTLDMVPAFSADTVGIHNLNNNFQGKGIPGDLYLKPTWTSVGGHGIWMTHYYILKQGQYNTLPAPGGNRYWIDAGSDEGQARKMARKWADDAWLKDGVTLYHGVVNGDLNFHSHLYNQQVFISDGDMLLPGNTVAQEGGVMILQGHPVIHAYSPPEVAAKLKGRGDNSVKTQPVSFDQPDWENRIFRMKTLSLQNVRFSLARNAALFADINADRSPVTLGSPSLYIDLHDGDGASTILPRSGNAEASRDEDRATYTGHIQATSSPISITGALLSASITADNSSPVTLQNARWQLSDHSDLSRLTARNSTVTLSDSGATKWIPHTLMADYLTASHLQFNLTARPQTRETDRIDILKQASGTDNQLNVVFLLDETRPVRLASDLTLASAPSSTQDDYFSVAPVLKGLGVYHPNFATVSQGDRKRWVLVHNVVPMTPLTPGHESIPMTPLTPAYESIPMMPLIPAMADPTGFFVRENNMPLIRRLDALMAIPQISFIQETNQLNKRLGDIRHLDGQAGFWMKVNSGRAGYGDMTLYHQTVQMGVDKHEDHRVFGLMGSYTRGHSGGVEDSVENTTGGAGLYYCLWKTPS
ncbi:autotransporter outer membrane beta-barrel domain-containing protein, partial [Salmonella enterica]